MDSDRMLMLHDSSLSATMAALESALAGGRPIAPIPPDPVQADRAVRMLQPDISVTEPDAAVIVSTSGSTGEPKGVVLQASALCASADATHRRLGAPGRWLLALPTHYVAGLMVLVRAIRAGQPVAAVGSDLAGLPDAVAGRTTAPDYLSLVPTQLSRGLADPALAAALARVDAVLLGGAPASSALLERAAAAGVRVITTYGMSETCGGCVYDGRPLPGVEIGLDPDPRNDQPDAGRVLIGGPMIFAGYRLRPDLTEQTLVNGRVHTQDRGSRSGDLLRILGRFDDMIISGGLKIDLAAAERVARDWPAVGAGELALIGIPDPDWGTRLVAVIESVPTAGELTLTGLHDYLADRLAPHERPRDLITVAELPRTDGGKIDRRRLAAELTAAGPGTGGQRNGGQR